MAATSTSTKGSTSSGSGDGSFLGTLMRLALMVAVGYGLYNLYMGWVSEQCFDSAQQLESIIDQETWLFTDSEGYVNEASAGAYQDAVLKCVQDYEGDRVDSYGKTRFGVWVKFDNGFTLLADPIIDGYLNADVGGTCTVDLYRPHEFQAQSNNRVEMIRQTVYTFAGQFNSGYSYERSLSQVDRSAVNIMGAPTSQQIIIWFGHGSYTTEDGSYLMLAEQYSESRVSDDRRYYDGIDMSMIGKSTTTKRLAVNSKYIEKYVDDLDGALVILVACHSGQDSKLADAFIEAGADTVIGFSDVTMLSYAAGIMQSFTETMCMRDANGNYPNVYTALNAAKGMVGENDSAYGGVGARPVIFGDGWYCLEGGSASSTNSYSAPTNTDSYSTTTDNSYGTTTDNSYSDSNNNSYSDSSTDSNSGTSNNDGQTAPMPDSPIQESQIIGTWSPDPDALEPEYIEFFKEGDQLRYYYYRVVLGDGSGFNIGNETTEFEYNSGQVAFWGNQGSCLCMVGESGNAYISFYLFDIDSGVIQDQESGEPFYRVE